MARRIPPQRRGVSRSSRRAGRGAVAAFGVPDVHPSRRPKVREPDGRFRHGLLGGSAVSPCQRPGADRGHQRRVKGPPQDSHSKPKTPRAGRRRFRRTCGSHLQECLGIARCRGPWVFRDPGVPRALFGRTECDDGRTNLGFTRDWLSAFARSAKADLAAPAQKIRGAERWLQTIFGE